jgi:hypothetical protein
MPRSFGTWLVVGGLVLVVIGLLANSGLLSWFGRLPGDIRIERDNVRFYFPVVSMIVVSVVFSLVVYLVGRFWR